MNPATAFATVFADELIRGGLREAVLAPGSRSTPLALALHDRAAAGDLRLHVRIDERSAAFTALGLAKAARRPVAVVCTSGTAGAHFHAAVIEADEAGSVVPAPARPSTSSSSTGERSAGSARRVFPRPGWGWPGTGVRWPAGPGRLRAAGRADSPGRCT